MMQRTRFSLLTMRYGDEEAQLYQHAQYTEKKVKMPHWSRANGWGIWALTEVLKELPKNHPQYKKIVKHYQNHVKSLVRYQTSDGFWRNVMDVEESIKETSGNSHFCNGHCPRDKPRLVKTKGLRRSGAEWMESPGFGYR